MYYFEDHTADVLLVVKSSSLLEFFNDILNGLFELFDLHNENKFIKRKVPLTFKIFFDSAEDLVFKFINKYVYFVDARMLVLEKILDFKMKRDSGISFGNEILFENEILFKARGLKFSTIRSYLKAPTYHNLEVNFDSNNFYCRVVLDV